MVKLKCLFNKNYLAFFISPAKDGFSLYQSFVDNKTLKIFEPRNEGVGGEILGAQLTD